MKVPVSWLSEYFAQPIDARELSERLTLSGIEVDSITPVGALDPQVVVCELLALTELRPGTQRLEVQADRRRVLVSNAAGLAVGQRLALALPGATLFTADQAGLDEVRAAEAFGVNSEAVVANAATLGLGDDATRPVLLPASAPLGAPLAAVLSLGREAVTDEVMLLAILPNIARCQAMVGVAREVAALLRRELRLPAQPAALPPTSALSPSITAEDACTALSVTLLEGVQVTTSPRWLQRRLALAGMTPINNVVDASNYVMLELGQPTHPYDADRLPSPDLGVRRSRSGERLLTLQQAETDEPAALPEGVPVITSADVPVAVAGVLGGRSTAIHVGTTRVLLEAAAFEYVAIRRSQQATKVFTEASARFSRGVNPELPALAARRFVELLRETAPDLRVVGAGVSARATLRERPIELSLAELNGSLGTAISLERAAECLEQVGLRVTRDSAAQRLRVLVDNTRLDLTESCDLLEEVARIEGYDNIPETMPNEPIPERRHVDAVRAREALRDLLVQAGLQEIISYSLNGAELEARLFAGHADAPRPSLIPVLNPVSAERAVLRSSLLPGLLNTAASNLRHAVSVRLFELGPVFVPKADPRDVPDEPARVTLVLAGQSGLSTLHEQKPRPLDFFDLKALVERLWQSQGLGSELALEPYEGVPYRPGAAARLLLAGDVVGTLGAVHPRVLQAFDIGSEHVFVADLALLPLLSKANERRQFRDYDRLPSIELDIAAFVERSTTAGALRAVAREAAGPLLRQAEVFDEFYNAELGDKKSIAIRLRLNAGSRTLEMAEAVEVRGRVARALESNLGAKIRE